MIDYHIQVQSQQRDAEIARRCRQTEREGWTYAVPNVFDRILARLKPKAAKTPSRPEAVPTLVVRH